MRNAYYNHDIPYVTQHIILQGNPYATFSRPRSWRNSNDDGWCAVYPTAYICPFCLSVWAQSYLTHSDGSFDERPFALHPVSCEACGREVGTNPPGSLIETLPTRQLADPGILDFAPTHLLEREFQLLLKGKQQ